MVVINRSDSKDVQLGMGPLVTSYVHRNPVVSLQLRVASRGGLLLSHYVGSARLG